MRGTVTRLCRVEFNRKWAGRDKHYGNFSAYIGDALDMVFRHSRSYVRSLKRKSPAIGHAPAR